MAGRREPPEFIAWAVQEWIKRWQPKVSGSKFGSRQTSRAGTQVLADLI
jgi:hypothetical protein